MSKTDKFRRKMAKIDSFWLYSYKIRKPHLSRYKPVVFYATPKPISTQLHLAQGSDECMETLNIAGYKCQALYNKGKGGTPIVFLHGLSYDIGVWQRIKTLDALIEKNIPFLALDMPYGTKSQCEPKTREVQPNVTFATEAIKHVFGDEAPVLVGASIGGYIALNYAATHPVKGLLLIAPAYAFKEMDLALKYQNFHFPVRIIWGSNDTVISGEEMRTLADKLPSSKLLVYNNAAHSAYQDQPEWFKTDLLKLYVNATV